MLLLKFDFLLSLYLAFLSFPFFFFLKKRDEWMEIIMHVSIDFSQFNQKMLIHHINEVITVSQCMVNLEYYNWMWHLLSCIFTFFYVLSLDTITKLQWTFSKIEDSLSIEMNDLESTSEPVGQYSRWLTFLDILFCKVKWAVLTHYWTVCCIPSLRCLNKEIDFRSWVEIVATENDWFILMSWQELMYFIILYLLVVDRDLGDGNRPKVRITLTL